MKNIKLCVTIIVYSESEVFVLSYSYEIPKHIFQQLVSLLKADRLHDLAETLAICKIEFKDVGLAYYAGLKGDNWGKHALDCSLFVPENKVEQVQRFRGNLKSSLSKLLPCESGLLIRDITIIPELDSINVTLPEKNGETWETLYIDITQALLRNEPSLVLDRLHTFSVKFIREICNNKGMVTVDDKGQQYPLHSLSGMLAKYYKNNDMFQSEFSEQALKTSISLFDKYNNVRNDQSFAHDNEVLNKAESTLAVKIMTAVITFIEEIEK